MFLRYQVDNVKHNMYCEVPVTLTFDSLTVPNLEGFTQAAPEISGSRDRSDGQTENKILCLRRLLSGG